MSTGLSSPQPWDDQRYNTQEEIAPQEVELETLVGVFKPGYYIEVHPLPEEVQYTKDPDFDAGTEKIAFSIPSLITETASFIPQVGKTFMVLANKPTNLREVMEGMTSLGSVEVIKQLKKDVFKVITFQGGQDRYFLVKAARPALMH